ncbi:hypothetical protein ACF5W4_11890 [Bacillota bacterium Lsc_1132]
MDVVKQKAAELKAQGFDVQITNNNGYSIVSAFDKLQKVKKPEDVYISPLSTLGSVNAHQYIYYGYTFVGEITGQLNIEIISNTLVSIQSYSLSLNNAKGYGQRVDSQYYSPKLEIQQNSITISALK